MQTFLEALEQVLKVQNEVALDHILRMWGFRVKIYKPVKSVMSRVYGPVAGHVNDGTYEEVIGVVVPDDFFPTGPVSAGNMQEGWLFTKAEVLPDSTMELHSGDGRKRQYKVTSPESLGMTTVVFKKYRLAAIVG